MFGELVHVRLQQRAERGTERTRLVGNEPLQPSANRLIQLGETLAPLTLGDGVGLALGALEFLQQPVESGALVTPQGSAPCLQPGDLDFRVAAGIGGLRQRAEPPSNLAPGDRAHPGAVGPQQAPESTDRDTKIVQRVAVARLAQA